MRICYILRMKAADDRIFLKEISGSGADGFDFAASLIEESFDEDERRSRDAMARLADNEPRLHIFLVHNALEPSPKGVMTLWDLGDFCYLEHFATISSERGKGYGSKALSALKSMVTKPIVLEVEPPVDELSRRRVEFYRRNGFSLWQSDYVQPPYRKDSRSLHLRLMAYGPLDEASSFVRVRSQIHTIVYSAPDFR